MSPGSADQLRLALLVTCHNRVEMSTKTIPALVACLSDIPGLVATAFIVDDGSTDGTGEQLSRLLPDAVIDRGDGSLFWNGGMCRAYRNARKAGSFDAYLLFNDDVTTDCANVRAALDEFRQLNAIAPAIVAAATTSSDGTISYSAFRRTSRLRPLAVERILPTGKLEQCDTCNGNFVLVPGQFFEEIGGLDRKFRHTYGDIDLGYVASRRGVATYLASQPIGQCEFNLAELKTRTGGWLSSILTREWRKGDSFAQRARFITKHSPAPAAPVLVGIVALSAMAGWVRQRLVRH